MAGMESDLAFAVENINQLPQAAEISAVKHHSKPRQIFEMLVVGFEAVDGRLRDAALLENVRKFVVETLDKGLGRLPIEPDDKAVANVSHAVVDRVKPDDFLHGLFDAVCDFEEGRDPLPRPGADP